MFLDLTKNNSDRKDWEKDLVDLREQSLGAVGKERASIMTKMRKLRKKIEESLSKRGYKLRQVGTIKNGIVLEHARIKSVDVRERVFKKDKWGKHTYYVSRAMTYEEHQEYLKNKKNEEEERKQQ